MKKISLLILILLHCFTATTFAFRCGDRGNNLAREGMHKYQILKDCGPPVSKEIIGIDARKGRIRSSYRIIEEWVYIEEDRGIKQMYVIKFNEEGVAAQIKWLGEQE